MRRTTAVSVLMIAGFIFFCDRPAAAQGVAPSYAPASPTLSPWLNLYQKRGAGGPLDPYNQFVAPELSLQDALRQQSLNNQWQGAGISSLGQQMTQMQQDRVAGVRPTGTGSVFMSYMHYYPAQAPRPRASWTAPGQRRFVASIRGGVPIRGIRHAAPRYGTRHAVSIHGIGHAVPVDGIRHAGFLTFRGHGRPRA